MNQEADEETDEALILSRSIFDYVFKLFYPIYYVLSIPFRVTSWFFTNFPVFSSFSLFTFISTLLIALYIFRRISATPQETFIAYILYTVVPYGVSIVYTVVGFVFPQVHLVTRVISALLHPIKFILGFVEKVDKRAAPIRRTVEAIHGSKKSTRESIEETLNDQRLQCCICQLEEKKVLIRPCNHFCLCQRCNDALQKQHNASCPICRQPIESFDLIFLS